MVRYTDDDSRINEQSFLMLVPLFAVAGIIWASLYYYFGARMSAFIPGSYSIVSFISLFLYRRYRNFIMFRRIQLTLILILPCLLHLSLGDINSSSAVIIWSTLCPLGALAFHNLKAATHWIYIFLAVFVSVFFLEHRIFPAENALPPTFVRVFFILNFSVVTLLTFYVLRFFVSQNELVKKKLKEGQALLSAEREKSEKLLLNILPPSIAKRLKEGETVIADEHNEAAVLFADIVDFTGTSQTIPAAMLIENLNKIFSFFDDLVEKFGLEKIKTIGDSYMVAAGINGVNNEKDFMNLAELALAMSRGVQQFSLDGTSKCEIRIGIDAGPVVAGVIGSKKFLYDIWGDAVNTASRMESSGVSGKIQVTQKFFESVKGQYECAIRGQVEIKGKGLMNLYFLVDRKKTATEN